MSKNKCIGFAMLLCSLSFLMMGCENKLINSTQMPTANMSQNNKLNYYKIVSEEREFS